MPQTTTRKFENFTNQELLEILAAFQSCSRNNKVSRKVFEELEKEMDLRHA
jgi:hypothetical protein